VSSASPFLDPLLTQWSTQASDRRRVHDGFLDQLRGARQLLDDARTPLADHRAAGFKTLEAFHDSQIGRWIQRLQRLDAWRDDVAGIAQRAEEIQSIIAAGHWLDRVETMVPAFARRLMTLSEKLFSVQAGLRQALSRWQAGLESKEQELQALRDKETTQGAPLLVSRSRKQPEMDFIEAQNQAERDLVADVQAARHMLHHAMDRLYRATRALERRAGAAPDLYESRKNQIVSQLREPQDRLYVVREEILSDALTFEMCRRKLRTIQTSVNAIRCIEDAFKPAPPFWKKLLR